MHNEHIHHIFIFTLAVPFDFRVHIVSCVSPFSKEKDTVHKIIDSVDFLFIHPQMLDQQI